MNTDTVLLQLFCSVDLPPHLSYRSCLLNILVCLIGKITITTTLEPAVWISLCKSLEIPQPDKCDTAALMLKSDLEKVAYKKG